jgi:hypothetical protein
MDDPAAGYFACTDEERAAFEAGIKLGSIFHQFVGSPVSSKNAENLARAIEEGTYLQPFVEAVRVRIDPEAGGVEGAFPYRSLTGEMLEIELRVRYGDAVASVGLRYEEELRYPLMRVRAIAREPKPDSASG